MSKVSFPHTDLTGQVWTQEEVQALVNQTGSFENTARRLGLKATDLSGSGILGIPEWVRQKAKSDTTWLPKLVLQTGSIKAAAEILGCSETHIKNVLKETGYETKMHKPNAEAAIAALQKFGSVLFAARLLETTPALIKNAVSNWRDYRDRTKVGTTSIRTGTIAENYFELVRGNKVQESPATENHNNKGFDHLDVDYGRVNSKGSVVSKSGKWTWDLDPKTDCDAFALVQLNDKREPVGMTVVTRTQVIELSPPRGMTAEPRSNGDVAIKTDILMTLIER